MEDIKQQTYQLRIRTITLTFVTVEAPDADTAIQLAMTGNGECSEPMHDESTVTNVRELVR